MHTVEKFTSADLALMPDDNNRYEIIEGELYVSRAPSREHQYACLRICRFLDEWNDQTGLGIALPAPGLIFGDDDDVIPDVIWISRARAATAFDEAGHLIAAPELTVEVLSPGRANEFRDREAKLDLYSRRGVEEYWIVDWILRTVEIYRRNTDQLSLSETLRDGDSIKSPLLPDFACAVSSLFLIPPMRQTQS
ncbi:MAG TPA: Uma2 family endonuclease [Blastocatellia bacterium]|nr:Uma2 family endonuclease [Blastocatellia bacterium]